VVALDNSQRATLYDAINNLVTANKLSSSNAKLLIQELLAHDTLPSNIEKYADEQGFIQVSDSGEIDKIVIDVITANPQAAEDVRNGEMKAIGFLVGQVMKASLGKANPGLAQELLKKHLS
jgi:aspartyl-tRNA(Asn)/glutamyl-tRNA(Gln) amidotransferase subunit B